MIRKAIIVVLMIGAVGSALSWCVTLFFIVCLTMGVDEFSVAHGSIGWHRFPLNPGRQGLLIFDTGGIYDSQHIDWLPAIYWHRPQRGDDQQDKLRGGHYRQDKYQGGDQE